MITLLKALNYLKALASFVGSIATGLSALYIGNETLTIILVITTAIATYAIPNLDPLGLNQQASVQPPEGEDDEDDEVETDAVDPDDVDVDDYNLPVDAMHEVKPSYGDPEAGPYHGDPAVDMVDPHRDGI